jgi:hypothetical protein
VLRHRRRDAGVRPAGDLADPRGPSPRIAATIVCARIDLLRRAAAVLFFQAHETAAFLGLVDGDQRRRWERHIGDLLGDDTRSEAERRDAGSEALAGLKAVLAGPVTRGGQRLVSVECYDGGLALRGESGVKLPAGLRDSSSFEVDRRFRGRELDPDVEVTDDVDTSYRGQGWGGSSDVEAGRYVSRWTSTFTPGVPAQTRTLTCGSARSVSTST